MGVRFVRIDQCRFGSEHFKPTGFLTNAPWIKDVLCDMTQRPHRHVPLIGLVKDYRGQHSKTVFYTALAAEYPEALCTHLVKELFRWVGRGQVGLAKVHGWVRQTRYVRKPQG
jgi:hypothetical protein